jgi:pimeloyl-ACP methyl ester carboxylesterase
VRDAGIRRAALTFARALRDPVESKLPLVRLPTLVTRGALEQVVSQRWAQEVAVLLPLGELAVVPGSPHDANYSAPDQLAEIVLPFLARVAAGPDVPAPLSGPGGTPPADKRPPCA